MARSHRFSFTDELIEALPTPRRVTEYADTVAPGLRLRVGKRGTRTFFFFGREESGKRTRTSVGRWSASGLGGTYNVTSARARFFDLMLPLTQADGVALDLVQAA